MKDAITVKIDENGIAELVFDLPDSSVNLLSIAVLQELEKKIDVIAVDEKVKALLFSSAKEGIFIAGADISEIKAFSDETDAYAKVREGQMILSKICSLPFPTVAIIDGAALGGGLELALCCDFRLATDSKKTKIGLPEVSLGVMPGFGGTQRLKRLVGLKKAVELILGSKLLSGKKAELLGVVDACVPAGYLDFKKETFLKSVLERKERAKIVSRRHRATLLERFLPNVILRYAGKEVMRKTKGQYPAPLALLNLYEKTEKILFDEAMELEARTFASLSVTGISKNLIGLFFTSESLKSEKGTEEAVALSDIKISAVIGGGVMGSGIVWLFSKADLLVRLKVRRMEQVGTAFKSISRSYEAIRRRKRLTRREIEIKMDHITYDTDFTGLRQCDIVVEAIVEDSDAKKMLYETLEDIVDERAVIATNTSSLSISSLAEDLMHPERFIGMHFFNPVNRMPLVEVIAGKKTSAQTIATVVSLAKKAGKTPIVVGDCAGFLVNRTLLPYINEAVRLLEEGEDLLRIDALLSEFGMPMGPFTLADEVGLDVGHKVVKVLEEAYGERMRPSPLFDVIVKEMGLLGKKSGKGFYLHAHKKKSPNAAVTEVVTERHSFNEDEIIDRTMLVMVNEAARCLEEGIVKDAAYLDMAMVLGTGFPPFRGGLMRYAQNRGIDNVVVTLHRLANAYGSRFEPAALLVEMAGDGTNFYEE